MRGIALAELLLCWIAWWYPFLFRAPHFQNRPSITVPWPTRIGLLLETSAFGISFYFHLPILESAGALRTVLGMAVGVPAVAMAWGSVTHLGRQFRLHAGLYDDHELVRTGPYAIVRHPIYSGLLLALLGTAIAFGEIRGLIGVALAGIGWRLKSLVEERFMLEEFGEQYTRYRHDVNALIPFVY